MTKNVFVDTGAFIALSNVSDHYHEAAQGCLTELSLTKAGLVTSNFVLDETYTHLKRRGGIRVAVDFGERIQAETSLKIITVDKKLEKRAWEIFKKYTDQPFSYTDCVSFALMQSRKIREVFGFDNDFRIFGFNLLP